MLVVLRGGDYVEMLHRTIDLVAGLSLEHEVVISRAIVSRERFAHEMSPFVMNVRGEAVAI